MTENTRSRHEMPGLDISRIDIGDVDLDQPLMRQRPDLDAPCMALYTSGTTGHPKGVLLSQANLAHFTAWYADYVQLTEQSRVLQFSSLSFDSSLIDIFPTLLQGAELIVPGDDQRRDPLQLVELIRHQRLSHAFLPPALLSILPLDQLQCLDHVMTGGDVCEPYVIEQLTRQGNLYNLYGPTEATVLITARQLRTGDSNRTLGAPIANSQVLILDEDFQPVAEQTVGELYIVGPGVCLGYLNNPQQTAERYLNLSLPNGQSLRAYRTGDMAKWTARRYRAVRAARQSGEDSRLPGRAGRDRTLPARQSAVPPGGGGHRQPAADSGLSRAASGRSTRRCSRSAESPRDSVSAGLHAAHRLDRTGRACRSPATARSTARRCWQLPVNVTENTLTALARQCR